MECGDCGFKCVGNKAMSKHKREHRGPAICEHCGASFMDKELLKNHVKRKHADEKVRIETKSMKKVQQVLFQDKKHQCSICGLGFMKLSEFESHRKLHDSGKMIACSFKEICRRFFATEKARRVHEKRQHKKLVDKKALHNAVDPLLF